MLQCHSLARDIRIEDEHLPWLYVQNGHLDHFTGDKTLWRSAYRAHLEHSFKAIRSVLPTRCNGVLDVGSGLGGVDILLHRHYGSGVLFCLVDGQDDPPIVQTHDQTFNDAAVGESFLALNGVPPQLVRWCHPSDWPEGKFDIILSLKSWCFHYPPAAYLDKVLTNCHKDTVLILDVRSQRPTWHAQLYNVFRWVASIEAGKKSERWVMVPK